MNCQIEPWEVQEPPEDDEIHQLFREARARRREEELAKGGGLTKRLRLKIVGSPAVVHAVIPTAGVGIEDAIHQTAVDSAQQSQSSRRGFVSTLADKSASQPRVPCGEVGSGNNQARRQELRRYLRLSIDSDIAVTWKAHGEAHEASGRCVDISVRGAGVVVSGVIPVASVVHLSFLGLNLEANGVVRHSSEDGAIGVEFNRLVFCGSLIRPEPRSLLARVTAHVKTLSIVVLLLILILNLPRIFPGRSPFSSTGTAQPMKAVTFTIGSTKSEVEAAQGLPKRMTDTVWDYGSSRVYFRGDRVAGWFRLPDAPLKVGVKEGQAAETKPDHFTVGSTVDEVLAAQGPPTVLMEDVWQYGASVVYLRDGRVVGWKSSPKQPLRTVAKGGPEASLSGVPPPSAAGL